MKLQHVLSRLYNTPLLISEEKLRIITENVTLELLSGNKPKSLSEDFLTEQVNSVQEPTISNEVALININGVLVSKNGAGASGFTSYEEIVSQTTRAIGNKAKTIVYLMDSPGGETTGNLSAANYIATVAKNNKIKTIALVNGSCNSACYALASAMDEIIATECSSIGSIGTVATLIDKSRMNEADGIDYTIIRSRNNKALYNPNEKISKAVVDEVTALVQNMDRLFAKTVTSLRSKVTMNLIDSLAGESVNAEKALELGLIDKTVVSAELTLQDIIVSSTKPKKGINMTLEESLARNAELTAKVASLEAELITKTIKAAEEERERVLSIIKQAETLGIAVSSSNAVGKFIIAKTDPQTTLFAFEAIAENKQLANPSPQGTKFSEEVIKTSEQQSSSSFAGLLAAAEAINTQSDVFSGKLPA